MAWRLKSPELLCVTCSNSLQGLDFGACLVFVCSMSDEAKKMAEACGMAVGAIRMQAESDPRPRARRRRVTRWSRRL